MRQGREKERGNIQTVFASRFETYIFITVCVRSTSTMQATVTHSAIVLSRLTILQDFSRRTQERASVEQNLIGQKRRGYLRGLMQLDQQKPDVPLRILIKLAHDSFPFVRCPLNKVEHSRRRTEKSQFVLEAGMYTLPLLHALISNCLSDHMTVTKVKNIEPFGVTFKSISKRYSIIKPIKNKTPG